MAHDDYPSIPADQHSSILRDQILRDPRYTQVTGGHAHPKAIILAGQPGAGKGGLTRSSLSELGGNAAVIDPDELRSAHPDARNLRGQKPYTWSGDTHSDASRWAQELRADAVAQRKNLILDTTMPRAEVIKDLQAKGYDVEVRAVATHRLESELGVDRRFTDDLDRRGHGRYVPQEVRSAVYDKLPGALDDVAKQTGVPVQIYDREGKLHFDSRTSPKTSPGQALETARNARLTPERLNDLHQSAGAQRQWHRDLPERVPNERVSTDTARNLLDERHRLGVEPGVQRLHNEVGGLRAVPRVVKGVGIAGAAYGAYDAKNQVDAAIDTARSNREQWVRGGQETLNQGTKTLVTGGAATVGAIPGAAAGTLTSPVTGPVGPIAGGMITGGAAAYGAEKLYEDSRLQQFSKYLGREAGQLGYDYVSREGRLLRQVNGLKEDLQNTSDPAERARLQGRLSEASTAFGKETERNGRYFEARAGVDQAWEQIHGRFPKVDRDDVQGAVGRHIDAGKRPADAVRGAYSDAVHEKYPRALPHQPLENYRSLSNEQLAGKHRQYAGEVAQDRRTVEALAANKDSHNNIDQGWPKALAQQRQAGRVQDGLNEFWRDTGHLGAIRDVYKQRGLQPPELPAELRPRDPQASPTRSGQLSLSPEQQRHHALAQEQLSPALHARGHDAEGIDRVNAAAVGHAQAHALRGEVRAFHLSKDGERVAMVQEGAPVSEFSVRAAQAQTSGEHLAQAHQTAHAQKQTPQEPTRSAEAPAAPTHSAPERSMA
ncbi:zeta toxin family protein [Hydrogenophaga sp. RWCD_12]|uniref:zeta toxin family protein n=1 Tax=Hydrogenophaga sp. RWCD_12 TaxID=3391190 RepID=UPI0039849943